MVGGFTDPQGSRTGFGALLLGYYAEGELRYAGKVGTGFDDATLAELSGRLADLRVPESRSQTPRDRPGRALGEPALVAEVGFTEWPGMAGSAIPASSGSATTSAPARS